jgi:hypothetical protein
VYGVLLLSLSWSAGAITIRTPPSRPIRPRFGRSWPTLVGSELANAPFDTRFLGQDIKLRFAPNSGRPRKVSA